MAAALPAQATDSDEDAEYLIATRNDCELLVEGGLNTPDTEEKFWLNKKLRIANRSHSSKLNDNSRKRMKLDDAAQSSSTVVTDANAEPGSSRQEQSMIAQDNQPMESAQTETTASDSNGTASSSILQQSLPMQELQESSILSVDVDTPILVIDDNQEVQPTSVDEQQGPSNQAISQFRKQPEPIRVPQIVTAPTIEMAQKLVEEQVRLRKIKMKRKLSTRSVEEQSSLITPNQLQDDAQLQELSTGSSRESTALLRNKAMSPQKINDVARINLRRSQNVNTVDPRINVQSFTKVASPSQSHLSSSIKCPSYVREVDEHRSLPNQQHSPTQSHQNQFITTKNNFEQDLLRKSAESNNYEQRQSQPSQQDSQRKSWRPTIRIGISIKPKDNRQTPTHQITKKSLSLILSKVLNSLRQAPSTTHSQYLLNDQQCQENGSAPVNENHLNEIDNTMQTDERVKEEIPSAHYGENSSSDSISDHEGDAAPIERTNNFYGTGITSGSSSADRPIDAQNSTNHQTHSKVVLEQQMSDIFGELSTQMGSTLRYTCDMYNTLRSSIIDTAKTHKKLLAAVEQFNSRQNSAGSGSFKIHLKPGVRQSSEERQTEVTASTSSSTQNQQSNDDATKPKKKKHNSWRFVLPSEYDPHDTKWTLKYRTNLPGLVELIPQTGVYVSYGDLIYCQQVSKDCKSLARRLLLAVFNRKALSICSTITENAHASDDVGSNIRPKLDDHACSVLLNFVIKYGFQRGWNVDLQPILRTLHSKNQEIRFKYGVVVQC